MSSKEFKNRKLILHKYTENPLPSQRSIAKSLNFPKTTIQNVLKWYFETQTIDCKPWTGAKGCGSNAELVRKVIRFVKQNPGLSDKDRAEKLEISKIHVRRICLKAGLRSYRAIKVPNRLEKQNLIAKKWARLPYKTFWPKKIYASK